MAEYKYDFTVIDGNQVRYGDCVIHADNEYIALNKMIKECFSSIRGKTCAIFDHATDRLVAKYDGEKWVIINKRRANMDVDNLTKLRALVDVLLKNEPSDEDLDFDADCIEVYSDIHNLKESLERIGFYNDL